MLGHLSKLSTKPDRAFPTLRLFPRHFSFLGWPTGINNRRLQGQDFFRIRAAGGHKAMNVFKRHHTVRQGELKALAGENQ